MPRRSRRGSLCQRDRWRRRGLLALAGPAFRDDRRPSGRLSPLRKRGRDRDRCSFTTGAMRLEHDRRHLTPPEARDTPHAREHSQDRTPRDYWAGARLSVTSAPRHEDRRRGEGRRLPAPAPGHRGAFLGRRRRRRSAQVGDGRDSKRGDRRGRRPEGPRAPVDRAPRSQPPTLTQHKAAPRATGRRQTRSPASTLEVGNVRKHAIHDFTTKLPRPTA